MLVDIQLWIIVAVLFLLFVFGLSFLISAGGKKQKKHRHPKPIKTREQKDWQEVSLRLEKHINSLRKENLGWQKKIKVLEKELEIYKEKNADLKEKNQRERSWQKKETVGLEKKSKRIKQLEIEIKNIERVLESEHSELIFLRRESAEFKETAEREAEQIKSLDLEVDKAKAQSEAYRKDILDLRGENKKLSQKHEDVQWIAKSVHMKVKEELRQKSQECEHLRKELIKKN